MKIVLKKCGSFHVPCLKAYLNNLYISNHLVNILSNIT